MTKENVNTEKRTEYVYTDEQGVMRHKTIRIDYPDKPKKIWQEPPRDGVWYPYNLPKLNGADKIFIVEGEKAADRMNAVLQTDLWVATTKPGGSSNPDWWFDTIDRYPFLLNKEIVILPDNDEPGMRYAKGVARAIFKKLSYANVKIVELPNLPVKGDFVEYRKSFDTDCACCDALWNLIDAAPVLEPADVAESKTAESKTVKPEFRAKITLCADIEPADPKWLLPNLIPKDGLVFITGAPGVGKTYWTCLLSSHVTNGYDWYGHPIEKSSVLFMEGESTKSVFVKRLANNGVDMKQCGILEGKEILCKDTGQWHLDPVIFQDISLIEKSIDEMESKTGRRVGMVVADPVGNFYGKADSYKDTEVRRLLMPMKQIAEKREIAFVLVGHHGKTQHAHSQNLALGSVGQGGIARSHCQIYIDKDDKELRYFAPSKVNDATEYKSVSYRIVKPLGEVQIVSANIDKQADDFMREERQGQNGRPPQELESAVGWLQQFLLTGKKSSTEIFEVAKESEGISKNTLNRAKEKLGIKPYQSDGKWWWELPNNDGGLLGI